MAFVKGSLGEEGKVKEYTDGLEGRIDSAFKEVDGALIDIEQKISTEVKKGEFTATIKTSQQEGNQDITLPFSIKGSDVSVRNNNAYVGVSLSPEMQSTGVVTNFLPNASCQGYLSAPNRVNVRWNTGQVIPSERHLFVYVYVKYID